MRKRFFAYLVYLILITLVVTAVSFSRYATVITAVDEAKAAKMVIEYVPDYATLNGTAVSNISNGITVNNVKPGDVLEYHFDIKNYNGVNLNQVLMKYRIIVHYIPDPSILPLSDNLSPDGSYRSAGGDWKYMGYVGEETHGYTLTVTWGENDDNLVYENQTQTIQIEIEAEQADVAA